MPTFIKNGYWEKLKRGYDRWLNLDDLILSITSIYQKGKNTPVVLTDASSIDIASVSNVLTTSSATRTFTISYVGDAAILEVTLNATNSVFTFPLNSLCVSDGTASGDNTLSLPGIS